MTINHHAMENEVEVKIYDTPEKLSKKAARQIAALSNEKGKEPLHIALSGGSTPALLYEILAGKYRDKTNWERIHFWWGDERCVDPSSLESNFRMASERMLSHVPVPPDHIHRIRGEAPPEEENLRYRSEMESLIPHSGGFPVFDLILLGMGDDGHIASIFPGNLSLLKCEAPCEVAEHPLTGQKRITLTGKTINNARRIFILVTGTAKSQRIAEIMDNKKSAQKLPAYFIDPVNGLLIWYLDVDAAALI